MRALAQDPRRPLPDGARHGGRDLARALPEARARRRRGGRGDASRSCVDARRDVARAVAARRRSQAIRWPLGAMGSAARAPSARPPALGLRRRRAPTADAKAHPARLAREVRHVAVVTLQLHGFASSSAGSGPAASARAADKIRAMLDDIAYKRGARFDRGRPTTAARALVGLMANPARAAADAAWLAHRRARSARRRVRRSPVTPVRASIGIVRGIASGRARSARAPRAPRAARAGQPPRGPCSASERRSDAPGSRAASTAWCGAISAGATRRPSSSAPRRATRCRRRCASTRSSGRSRAKSAWPSSRSRRTICRARRREGRSARRLSTARSSRPRARSSSPRHRRRDGHRQDGARRDVPLRAAARRARAARRVLAGADRASVRRRERVRARSARASPPSNRSTRSSAHRATARPLAHRRARPSSSRRAWPSSSPGKRSASGDDDRRRLPAQARSSPACATCSRRSPAGSRSSSSSRACSGPTARASSS